MTPHEFLRALDGDNLGVEARGRGASHKPLLLLLALGWIAQQTQVHSMS